MSDDDPSELTDDARELLLGPVDSFEKLQLLIALRGAGDAPQRLVRLETSTGTSATVLMKALEELSGVGLVARHADRWAIAPDCNRAALEELVEAWSSNPAAVLDVMTKRSLERIRASAARAFADAFTLRPGGRSKRGDDDG